MNVLCKKKYFYYFNNGYHRRRDFHDSMTEIDEDEIILTMLFSQIEKIMIELSTKIDIAKSDIAKQLQYENTLLKKELRTVKAVKRNFGLGRGN